MLMQYRPATSPNVSAGMRMAAPGARRIELKLLLVTATGDEPSYLAARSALDRMSVPYDALVAATTNLTPDMLSNGVDTCHYRGIVIAVGGLGYLDTKTQAWTSAFTADAWTTLASYESACSARELIWYGLPSADVGLAPASSFSSNDTVAAKTTSAGAAVFPYVQASASIPISSSFGYKASVADPAATTPLIQSDDGGTLVARHVGPDGREAMIMTMDSNPNLTHALVLEYGLVNWVSRGLFIGKKRAYLTPQVDDVFIDDDVWDTSTHRNNPELDGMSPYRITGSDVDLIVSWQTKFAASLPAGSSYTTVMAFNGTGAQSSDYPDETLLAQAQAAGDNLMWMSHTWDHENMDLMASSAAGAEVTQNCDLAATYGLNKFSCEEMVTPDISGLSSTEPMLGMLGAGVHYVVSDSSVTAEVAKTRNTTPGDNPSFNVGRVNSIDASVYHVPRHPTSIFYDVTTRDAEVDEYNTIYRSYWGRDLSYEEILDVDSSFGLHYLLTGDIDPLMFHQTNLSSEYVDNTEHSVFADWVEASAGKFTALVNFPIRTLTLQEIASVMQARDAFNTCGAAATYVEAGSAHTLELKSSGTCVVPITGVSSPVGTVDVYGGVPTTEVQVSAGATKVIKLP